MTSWTPPNTNVQFHWTSFLRSPGVCVGLLDILVCLSVVWSSYSCSGKKDNIKPASSVTACDQISSGGCLRHYFNALLHTHYTRTCFWPKWLIAIQNKSLIYVCVLCVFSMYIEIHTQYIFIEIHTLYTHSIYFENIYMYSIHLFVLYISIFKIYKQHIFLKYIHLHTKYTQHTYIMQTKLLFCMRLIVWQH